MLERNEDWLPLVYAPACVQTHNPGVFNDQESSDLALFGTMSRAVMVE